MSRNSFHQWMRAFAQPMTYFGVAMLIVLFATLMYLIYADRNHAISEALRHGENIAQLFGQSVTSAIKSADNLLLLMRRSHEQKADYDNLVKWAADPSLKTELRFNFSIVDGKGRITASSYPGAVGLNVEDREYFKRHRTSADERLQISPPVRLRTTSAPTIMLSRRMNHPDASFAGMIVASLEIQQLERFYRTVSLGKDGVVALVGGDGIIRAAGANGESRYEAIGLDINGSKLLRALQTAPSGAYWNMPDARRPTGVADDVPRLVIYRALEDSSLTAVVAVSETTVFVHANSVANVYLSIVFLLTVTILLFIGIGATRERKLIAATAEITRQAYQDGLTELANRAFFRIELERAIERFKATGESFNFLVLDLDNFKAVNDSLGHTAGDELIRRVAHRLEENVGRGGVVARLGGDEFAILQPAHGHQREEAILLADKLLGAVGEPCDFDGHQIMVETSIGIALAPMHGDDAHQLLKNADLALYKAKAEGRNTMRIFEEHMNEEARHRYALECELRHTAATGNFEVHYQPILDTATARMCGVEALMRWTHPRYGEIAPDVFIPIAESTGLIVSLGEQALRQACNDAVTWPVPIKVAVNLSPVQFRSGDIFEIVASALRDSGLPPERLELEITESVLLQGTDSNLSKLHELKTLGVSISLDDFGTGYSSLSYLQTFPFDKIKIDRRFVAGMGTRADCAAIVCAVTGLARTLDILTLGEGVETREQFELLAVAGCDQAQGFLFGRPGPACDIPFFQAAAIPSRELAA